MTTITGLSPNTRYFFRIRAVDDVGQSPDLSNEVSMFTSAQTVTVPADGQSVVEDPGGAEAGNELWGRTKLGPKLSSGLDRQFRAQDPCCGEGESGEREPIPLFRCKDGPYHAVRSDLTIRVCSESRASQKVGRQQPRTVAIEGGRNREWASRESIREGLIGLRGVGIRQNEIEYDAERSRSGGRSNELCQSLAGPRQGAVSADRLVVDQDDYDRRSMVLPGVRGTEEKVPGRPFHRWQPADGPDASGQGHGDHAEYQRFQQVSGTVPGPGFCHLGID